MSNRFTQKAQHALTQALATAQEMGHTYVGTEHILMGLLLTKDSIACRILTERGVSAESTKELIASSVGTGSPSSVSSADMTPMTKKVIEESAFASARMSHNYIGTEHLLLAIISETESFANKLIRAQNASVSDIKNDLFDYFGASFEEERGEMSQKSTAKAEKDTVPGAPTLSKYGTNLCKLAKEGRIDPIIGRDNETERVIQILSRRTKNNPCLIGEPGVGKTAVVEGLAQQIADGTVPENLRDKIIVTLDISSMVAGAKYRGEFEERMKGVMEEVAKDPRIILFVDEIHTIIGAGGAEGAVDAANIIKPALARGAMQLIGATTIDEYRKHIEKDAALERRFQSVMVGEPTPEEAVQILMGLRDKYEAHHKLKISDDAIEAAVQLSVRYIGDRFLPDKAIDLIDEAASRLRIKGFTPTPEAKELEEKLRSVTAEKEEAILGEDYERAAKLRDSEKTLQEQMDSMRKDPTQTTDAVVGRSDIEDIITSWTGIPVKKLAGEESERMLHLDQLLRERIIGQDAAVDAVAKAIRRGRTGLKDPNRPVGSFIFLGPTGVGKTELTKALADVMFGNENAMIRVDMSEYMEKHSTSKMIGSPPGYVGYDEGGQLTEKIRRHPYSVVLFDEIEKAHPDVFNILLQILEDGILTDAQGRRVDFKNTVIIMTSNVGAGSIVEPKKLGFAPDKDNGDADMRRDVMDALKRTFRPEFLNRVDEIVIFNKLTDTDIQKIAGLMLEEVAARIGAQGIHITFDDAVAAMLAKEGFDPVYGARPLRRAIVRKVEDSFSEEMLSGRIQEGDRVRAVLQDGEIAYEKEGEI
ncbi:MAG: ATP-dependent Clp protease ATP-binding subunit [Clostridiales bacterium]|jgi:ATP-dependent Clp protease ATP-binding subunit ClpC|nr:ATP-dependent Clp protease ATP-binding subunit [Clostridiales bacterium]